MNNDINWNLLARYLFGECSEEEAAQVQAWIEGDPVRETLMTELRHLVQMTQHTSSVETWDTEALWNRVQKDTQQEGSRDGSSKAEEDRSIQNSSAQGSDDSARRKRAPRFRHSRTSRAFGQKAITVGVLVLVVVAAAWLQGGFWEDAGTATPAEARTFVTQEGEQSTVRLTDGTRVRLNVDSRLVVSARFGKETRRVQLEGEAFFEVATDPARPFIVRASEATTRVLGTAFDLSAYPEEGETKVVVSEGRVAVQSDATSTDESSSAEDENRTMVLKERQMGRILRSGEQVVRRGLEVDPHLAWLEGKLVFEETPYEGVVRKLERWYDLTISLEEDTSPPAGHLNARFTEDQPLRTVLGAIATAFGLDYERDERHVTFVRPNRPRSP